MESANITTTNNDNSNWRNELSQESRQKIVKNILDTFQRHMPFTGPDGMDELKKIALRFEENIYAAAVDQEDYLRKISLKMLSLRNHVSRDGNSLAGGSNSNQKPLDPVVVNSETGLLMPPQMRNTSHLPAVVSGSGSLPGQPQPQEASLPQEILHAQQFKNIQHQEIQIHQQQQQQQQFQQQKHQDGYQNVSPGLLMEDKLSTKEPPFEHLIKVVSQDMSFNEVIFQTMRMGNIGDLFRQIIDTAQQPHLGVLETKDVKSQKHYRRLLFRSFIFLWVGTAVTVLSFIAYMIYTRRANSS